MTSCRLVGRLGLTGVYEAARLPGSLHYATRRTKNVRKRKPGRSGRDDKHSADIEAPQRVTVTLSFGGGRYALLLRGSLLGSRRWRGVGRSVRCGCGSSGRVRFGFGLPFCRFGIGRRVIGKMIGGLFVGGADGFAPVICAEGVDVFVLGEVEGLE